MKKTKRILNLIVFVASLGGLLYGYDIGVIAGTLGYLKDEFNFTNEQLELIVGGVFIGSLIGSLIAGNIADYFGRKLTIAIASILFILGTYIATTANSFNMFFIARLFLGAGVGIVSVVIPLYIVEVAPAECRGKCLASFQSLLAVGILLAYLVDFVFSFSGNWRAMFACLFVPSIILLLLTNKLPETPRWLILNNKFEKAKKILEQTRQLNEAQQEFELIKKNNHVSNGSWKELFRQKNIYFLVLTITIASCNQLIGANAILQYAPIILKNAGIESNIITMLGTVGIGVLNLLFGVLNLIFVDVIGRRPLYLIGTFGVLVSEVLLGISGLISFSPLVQSVLALVALLMFISFYAVGPGTLVWLAISELLPNTIRAKGMSVSLFFNGLISAISSSLFLMLNQRIGMSGIFLMFSIFAAAYWLVIKYFLPESKNVQLENIISIQNQKLATVK